MIDNDGKMSIASFFFHNHHHCCHRHPRRCQKYHIGGNVNIDASILFHYHNYYLLSSEEEE